MPISVWTTEASFLLQNVQQIGGRGKNCNFKCRNFCTEQKYRSVCKEYDIYTESDHIQELLKPNGMFEK